MSFLFYLNKENEEIIVKEIFIVGLKLCIRNCI